MAREYGRIFTRIWADPAFRAIGRNAQHLYFQLISQPDLSMAGVVTLAPTRWATQADVSEDEIIEASATLAESKFIAIDIETQEILVRSYIRWDGGWRSPTTMKAVASAMDAVLSMGLKNVLLAEVDRLDTATLSETINEKTHRSTREVVEAYIASFRASVIPHPIPHAIPHAMGYPMGIKPFSHGDGTEPEPEPEPEPTIGDGYGDGYGAIASSPATPSTDRVPAPALFETFWTRYPRKVGKDAARRAWKSAIRRAPAAAIAAAAARYAEDPNLPEAQFIPHPSKWLNDGRWADGPLPLRRDGPHAQSSPRIATADQRLIDGAALAERLRREESEQSRMEIEA